MGSGGGGFPPISKTSFSQSESDNNSNQHGLGVHLSTLALSSSVKLLVQNQEKRLLSIIQKNNEILRSNNALLISGSKLAYTTPQFQRSLEIAKSEAKQLKITTVYDEKVIFDDGTEIQLMGTIDVISDCNHRSFNVDRHHCAHSYLAAKKIDIKLEEHPLNRHHFLSKFPAFLPIAATNIPDSSFSDLENTKGESDFTGNQTTSPPSSVGDHESDSEIPRKYF